MKAFTVDRGFGVMPVEPWSLPEDAEHMRRYTEILQAWADVLTVAVSDEGEKDRLVALIRGSAR